ncbi:MAG: hypothetical protein AAGD11_17940 [Planctomycetota bacterium]
MCGCPKQIGLTRANVPRANFRALLTVTLYFHQYRPIASSTSTTAVRVLFFLLIASVTRAQDAQHWWAHSPEFRTRYYNVKTDLTESDARHLATHMDITFEAYARLFAGLKARTPKSLDLYLFADQQDYNAVLAEKFRAVGTGSWGMAITRRGETSLVAWQGKYSRTDMESVLQHEGFHQFARYLFPRLPSWANEGLAEVFQRGVEIDGKIVLGEVSPRDLLMLTKATEQRQFRSFAQFFTMDQRVWNQHVQYGQANTNYLQAWCIVHFFLYADGAKYQPAFMDFLVGLNRQLPWQEAFVRAYGSPDFSAMEQKWLDYVVALQQADYRETIRRLEFLAAGMRRLHEDQVYPLSISELQSALLKFDFEHRSDLFEKPRKMSASDATLFRAAAGNSAESQIAFRLTDAKGKPVEMPNSENAKAKLMRKLSRQPLQITTVGLEPRELVVRWKRAGKGSFQPMLSTE